MASRPTTDSKKKWAEYAKDLGVKIPKNATVETIEAKIPDTRPDRVNRQKGI